MNRLLPLAGLLLAALLMDGLATWTLVAAPGAARAGVAVWLLLALGLLGGAALLLQRLWRDQRWPGLLLAGSLLLSLGACAWRYAPEAWRLVAQDGKGIGVEALDGGRVLRLSGPLAAGDAARLAPLVQAARRVELSSSGGSPGDALALAAQLAESPRPLLLRGPCTRDCALLFLASPQRLALPGSYLGLQQLHAPSWNPVWQRWLDARVAPAYVPLTDLQRQRLRLSRAPHLSLLEGADLERLLSRPANPLALLLPSAPASADEMLIALQTHAVWPVLEQRYPGLLPALAEGLAAAPDDDARQQLAWAALRRQADSLAAEATPAVRLQALELAAEQLRALSDDADCRALGAGESAVRAKLPAALQAREAEWMRDSARDLQRDAPQLKPLEREMLSIVLGRTRLLAIDRLRSGRLGCAESRAVFDALLALPPAQRRLAAKRWALAPL